MKLVFFFCIPCMILSRSFCPPEYLNAINETASEYLCYKKVLQLSVLVESVLSWDLSEIC